MKQQPAPPRRTGQQVARQAQHATVELTQRFSKELDQIAPNIAQALPRHVGLDKFKRVLITACAMNPDLLQADRRTLYLAAIKCAADGLLPDGRQAALVPFNTEIKMRDPQTGLDNKFRIDAVQYMPMLAGIRERMRNTGEVLSADAHEVCKNDSFAYDLGDVAFIKHTPAPLGQERGQIIGAYAIIKLKSGEVIRDVMNLKEIEDRRQHSKAPNSLMWTKFYGEGARKTVLRRASKAAPQTSDLERLFDRDEEAISVGEVGELPGLPAPEPEPRRTDEPTHEEPPYCVVDADGEVFQFHEAGSAAAALRQALFRAKEQGAQFYSGVLETNRELLTQLDSAGEKIEIEWDAVEKAATLPTDPPDFFGAERS